MADLIESNHVPYLIVDPCQVAASYNYCLLDGLARQGAQVTYACADYAWEDMPTPTGVHRLRCFFIAASLVGRFTKVQIVRRILRAVEYPLNVAFLVCYIVWKRYRVVHFMWSLSPNVDVWLIRLLRKLGCKVVYTSHNAFPHERKPGDVAKYSRLYQAVDHLIVLTNNTAREIQEACPIPDERIAVIPHGDFGALHAAHELDQSLLQQVLAKAKGRPVIAFLGIIRPYKGIDYFIEAIPQIQAVLPDVYFLIAGSDALGDEARIRELVAANCQADDIWIDIRYLPISSFKAYVEAMDVLVMPYLSASQSGNTVMAYAAGVPVVATDVGGLGEMTVDGETGFVIPPKDSRAIAEAVCRFYVDDNYPRMSIAAKKAAEEDFSWSTIARQTISVYEQVAAAN